MSTKKQYWKGLEELGNTPEFQQHRDNEFPEEMPIDAFLGDEKLKESSTSRRDFLKFLGFSITAASLAACESPVIKSIPYVSKPEDIDPGVANWYATTYYDGNDYGSILVKSREGRPIFIKGNKYYGINKGAVNARITASVLSLYNTSRLNGPMAGKEKTDWATADNAIKSKLKSIAAKGGQIRILSGTVISPSTLTVINDFASSVSGGSASASTLAALTAVANPSDTASVESVVNVAPVTAGNNTAEGASDAPGNIRHIQYDAVSYSAIRDANMQSFGMNVIPDYDFSKAKVIVSIAADFINNWLLSNQYIGQYLVNRRAENDWMSRHFQFESILSVTGSNADVRVPVKPSQEGLVAAAIYQQLSGTSMGIPQEILDITKAAADELKKAGSASLVVAGSNDVNVQIIVNAINRELGNYDTTINLNNPVYMYSGSDSEMDALVKDVIGGKISAILIDSNVNPVYSHPEGKAFGEALMKMELSVSFSQHLDETASNCHYTCPDHHYLEGWNDLNPKANHYALAQPLISPLFDSRPMQESLLVWAGLAPRGDKNTDTYYKVIRKNWEVYGFPLQTEVPTFEEYWNWNVHNGSGDVPAKPAAAAEWKTADVKDAAKKVAAIKGGAFELVMYQKTGIGNGIQAANPWLQELPDPITKVTWDNYITMSPSDMEGYNLHIGQEWPASVATVSVGEKQLTLPVFPQPGQAKGTIGIALGYGRAAAGEDIGKGAFQYGEYGDALVDDNGNITPIGKNVFPMVTLSGGNYSYRAYDVNVSRVEGETYPLACTQIHHTIMGRESVLRETTFSVYKNGDRNEFNKPFMIPMHDGPESVQDVNLWNEHPVKHVGHRWGMSIDLNTCVGCGNCVVACQVENNVPVVGKDEVRRGREMHWLRLDRYYTSDMNEKVAEEEGVGAISMYRKMEVPSDNPEVVFMPMLCQHCNHAPCETVCPVAATTHSNEGLNMMTYNRCIGTRYCANNCPYKVRRFNWFNYPSYKKFTSFNPSQSEMGRLVLNPDVVVRTRGVMEKCSFCVQRIQSGKLAAKSEMRPVMDGEVVTACAEACPTNAISFGDWNDTESFVRKQSETDRAYQALEDVGVKPNIWYMVKVRNKSEENKEKTEA